MLHRNPIHDHIYVYIYIYICILYINIILILCIVLTVVQPIKMSRQSSSLIDNFLTSGEVKARRKERQPDKADMEKAEKASSRDNQIFK